MALQFPTSAATSTLNRYFKEVMEPIYRTSILHGLLKKRGRIEMDEGGVGLVWPVQYYVQQPRNIAGPVTQTQYPDIATEVQAQLGLAGYDMGRSITKLMRLVNKRGDTQIYDVISRTLDQLTKDFMRHMKLRLWNDGTITGIDVMGIMSVFGASSTPTAEGVYSNLGSYTLLDQTTFGPSNSSKWPVANPAQTYAGLSTALGSKVNDWTAGSDATIGYPLGTCSPGFHFWSPFIWDYNSSHFTPNPAISSVHCWDTQWQTVVNEAYYTLVTLQQNRPDICILDTNLLQRAMNSTIAQQRFVATPKSEAVDLNFPTMSYNGIEFHTEYGVPSQAAFLLTLDEMSLHSWQKDWIEVTEDQDPTSSQSLHKVDAYWQMKLSPAHMAILAPISTAGT